MGLPLRQLRRKVDWLGGDVGRIEGVWQCKGGGDWRGGGEYKELQIGAS